jgi:flagellin
MATVDVTRIASNIGALNSLNSLMNINAKLATHQARLSTGKRINSAADDPAGLTIATKMLARSEGLKVTLDNIGDAKNMLSVAEGGLSKMTDIITQMRNKAEQAASDTLGSSERATIQTQLSSYAQQLQDVMDQTKWNGVKLLDNSTGSKLFQTGVDEGETTTWTLPTALDPATLNLSKVVASATSTNSVVGASYTVAGATTSGTLNNMSELATGDYSFEVLDKATSATQGKANLDASSKLVTGVGSMAGATTAASTDAMVSGRYKLTVDAAASATSTSYTLTNLDDNTWGNNGSIAVTGADLSDAGSDGDLLDAAGGATLGLNLGFTAGYATGAADLVAGQSMTFEYIAGGQVKLELNDSSGQALQVNREAADTTNYSATSAYVDAGSAYESGRGATVTLAAFATVSATAGNKSVFTYEQANNFSVDVSNASKAGKYMTTANNALDKVTSALSDLGSLMSRLTFKEDSISTAQINVEAAHSRIMNANMAEEQMNASKYTILQQTAIAMLAQANQAPQNLLSLFR